MSIIQQRDMQALAAEMLQHEGARKTTISDNCSVDDVSGESNATARSGTRIGRFGTDLPQRRSEILKVCVFGERMHRSSAIRL